MPSDRRLDSQSRLLYSNENKQVNPKKCNVNGKKEKARNECMLCDSSYAKFKNRQNGTMIFRMHTQEEKESHNQERVCRTLLRCGQSFLQSQ